MSWLEYTRPILLAASLGLVSACGGGAAEAPAGGDAPVNEEPAGNQRETEPDEYEPTGGCRRPSGATPCERYRTLLA